MMFRVTALVQVWNLEYLAKTREQECHDKGVKCMDLNHSVILTGSYDATFKVGRLMLLMTCLLCCALLCIVVHAFIALVKTTETWNTTEQILVRCGGRVTGAASRHSRVTATACGTSSCTTPPW